MAKKYLEDDTYFNPLSEGNNVLPFEHAYSHVNAFSSAMQAYITLGSEKHLAGREERIRNAGQDTKLCDGRMGTE